MKKYLGILMLAVTLISGITVLAQNSNSSTTMKGPGMSSGRGGHQRRHHRRWHRRHRRHGNANKH
jgi:hypothetical protein